jgi:hypothetical protein
MTWGEPFIVCRDTTVIEVLPLVDTGRVWHSPGAPLAGKVRDLYLLNIKGDTNVAEELLRLLKNVCIGEPY